MDPKKILTLEDPENASDENVKKCSEIERKALFRDELAERPAHLSVEEAAQKADLVGNAKVLVRSLHELRPADFSIQHSFELAEDRLLDLRYKRAAKK